MKKRNFRSIFTRIISVVLFILVWQFAAEINKDIQTINPSFLPSPTDVIATLKDYFDRNILFDNIIISVERVLKGFLIGSLVGILFGCFIASSKIIEDVIDPIISFIGAIPTYAFMPLFIIWFGVGESAKTALIAFATFMPVMTYTVQGVKSVNPIHIRSAKSLGVPDYKILWMVILKTATPFILSGMKISLAMSFSALIVAEMMGSKQRAWIYYYKLKKLVQSFGHVYGHGTYRITLSINTINPCIH